MEKENRLDGFNGEIGQNIPSTSAEKEEDLLEELYLWWKDERLLTPSSICIHLGITKRELTYLVRQMIKHGYLKETEKGEPLELTDFGKSQGAECLERHQYLSQFLQMVCGLEEKKAYEDACRMEHVVSQDAIRGICGFLKYGDTCDRVMRDLDLSSMYREGSYEFRMGIYCTEKRYPRILAEEYYYFSDKICLEVGEEKSSFFLRLRKEEAPGILWYKKKHGWKKAKREGNGFRIPTDIFTFTVSTVIPVTEGDGIVAFASSGREPAGEECRELNVHIW